MLTGPRLEQRDDGEVIGEATTRIDVGDVIDKKIAAIAAYRSQFAFDPSVVPRSLLQDLFGVPLLNTYLGMMLPFFVYPFGVFLMRQAMLSVPGELLDAARIDGASTFGIYWRIAMPLLNANLAALAIFVFMFKYNDLLWPLIVAQSPDMFPMAVGLLVFVGEFFRRGSA